MNWITSTFGFGKAKQNFKEMMANGAKVIDVRTRGEFQSGHVKGSVNIPLQEFHKHVNKLKKEKQPLILCCASGNRSGQAVRILKSEGMEEVYNGGSWMSLNRY